MNEQDREKLWKMFQQSGRQDWDACKEYAAKLGYDAVLVQNELDGMIDDAYSVAYA